LAKEPHSQLAQILKAKYHHDTSIWRAKPNKPKSAFWSAILKVKPLLVSASLYQIVDGNSSVWSSPWFASWETIYANLVLQQQPFVYPAQVKDLWIPGHKTWNTNLINSLFNPETANAILQTPIINANGEDTLIWKLTPTGQFSSKSAYKHCFNNLQLPQRQRPKIVPPQVISLLKQVWQDKQMAPRVQTFAWRLLRKALSTGKRASRYSKHINENCSRCGNLEDEMHMLFLCPFSKAAWYSFPWFIKTEFIAEHHPSVPEMIQALLTSQHPQINVTMLYTFLWCLWKARNNSLFCRKVSWPYQIYAAANAIIKGTNLEDNNSTDLQGNENTQELKQTPHTIPHTLQADSFTGNVIYCDAAWERQAGAQSGADKSRAGIGVIIHMQDNQHLQQLHVSALSPPASSPLQAETYGLLLATKLAEILQIQDPYFYTDSLVLASAAASPTVFKAPGHWENRSHLAAIQASPSFHCKKIAHINRSRNIKADHQARLALRAQNASLAIRCLCPEVGQCPAKDILSVSSVAPFTLVSVKCT
jgi:ribonuclease HI